MTQIVYGQPKIHKKDIPLRPIVSAIGATTHALSRFLADKLRPFMGSSNPFIKDSSHFIKKSKTIHLDPNDIMVSFHIVSFFIKILVPKTLDLISKLVDAEMLNLIKNCLISTVFSFKGTCYE